jgi:hypothetical protein
LGELALVLEDAFFCLERIDRVIDLRIEGVLEPCEPVALMQELFICIFLPDLDLRE